MSKRKIVCLCGSTRFKEAFEEATLRETLAGNIVLSVGAFPNTDAKTSPEELFGYEVKKELDKLHKDKIVLADEVLVLNVGGYIGESTKSEIAYAIRLNKPLCFLEEDKFTSFVREAYYA